MEALQKANATLEEKSIMFQDKEGELSALSRRIMLLEGEANNADLKLANTTMELALESKRADKVIKVVNALNSKAMTAEVEIEDLCKSEKEAKFIAADSEKKFDEISRRLGVVEEELRKAEERANSNQKKVETIDEELKVVGENMKALEVAEEKSFAREEKFKEQILLLLNRLKIADARAEYGEMNITKLNQRIDGIEDDIIRAKVKSSHVGGEMNDTFMDILHKY